MNSAFRSYDPSDRQVCVEIFDANCPEYFAPNERQDYDAFLADEPEDYEVYVGDGQVLGAFGLFEHSEGVKTLNWILLHPDTQGMGVGSEIMERVIQLARASSSKTVEIAASHKSAPFFARFGARTIASIKDGWGPRMDRIDMQLSL